MEQGNFKSYLLRKLVDYENQQLELRRKLLDVGETVLARQAEFDSSKLRRLALPFLDDRRCTTNEGFVKALDEHISGLSERYLKVYELSGVYAVMLCSDCQFLIWRLYDLHVLDYGDFQFLYNKLKELDGQLSELAAVSAS